MCKMLFIFIGTAPYENLPFRVKFYKMLGQRIFPTTITNNDEH